MNELMTWLRNLVGENEAVLRIIAIISVMLIGVVKIWISKND